MSALQPDLNPSRYATSQKGVKGVEGIQGGVAAVYLLGGEAAFSQSYREIRVHETSPAWRDIVNSINQ
jgi:hypothetical protein